MQGAEAIALPDNQNKSNRRGTHSFSIHCCMLLCTCQQTETPVPRKIKKKKIKSQGYWGLKINLCWDTIVFTQHFSVFKSIRNKSYPNSSPDEKLGVCRVTSSEDHWSSSKSSCSFSSYIWTRGVSVYLENTPWSVHVLWSLPTSVILISITHLQKNPVKTSAPLHFRL